MRLTLNAQWIRHQAGGGDRGWSRGLMLHSGKMTPCVRAGGGGVINYAKLPDKVVNTLRKNLFNNLYANRQDLDKS